MAEMKNVKMRQVAKNILILNYDCLYTIFEYLDIWDVFAAEEVCMKFQTVAEMIKPSLKTVDFDRIICRDKENEDVTKFVDEWMTILEWLGPQIQTFKFCDNGKDNIEVINFFIHENASAIDLFNSKANALFKELTKCNFPAVKVVHIQDWFDYFTDEILESMFTLKQIKVLNLIENLSLKGTFLSKLTNIQEFHFMNDHFDYERFEPTLEPQLFINFCSANPQLRSLSVTFSHATYRDSCACFGAIATKLINLKKLIFESKKFDISIDYLPVGLPDLAELPRLVLYIDENSPSNLSQYLQTLIAKFRFEYLDFSCVNISADTQEILASKLTHLKVLQIYGEFPQQIILNKLSCGNNLEEFYLVHSSASGRIGLINFILRHPCIRYINLSNAKDLDADLIHQIANVQKKRNHVLMIRVWESHLPPGLKETYNGKNATNLELIYDYRDDYYIFKSHF